MNFKGCRKKPGTKITKDQADRPLAGAEVLVAVGGPSPPSSEGGKKRKRDIPVLTDVLRKAGRRVFWVIRFPTSQFANFEAVQNFEYRLDAEYASLRRFNKLLVLTNRIEDLS